MSATTIIYLIIQIVVLTLPARSSLPQMVELSGVHAPAF
jgi:hypothetical protein